MIDPVDRLILSLDDRVRELERQHAIISEALLDYVLADLAEPWRPAAKRLEKVLVAGLKK